MEKNTVLAVVLSTVVLIGFFIIQNSMTAKQQLQQLPSENNQTETSAVTSADSFEQDVHGAPLDSDVLTVTPSEEISAVSEISSVDDYSRRDVDTSESAQTPEITRVAEFITIETNVITAVLTNAGGDMISWKLKDHKDKDESVDMIFSGIDEASFKESIQQARRAFSIAFGGFDAQPVSDFFNVTRISGHTVEFSNDYMLRTGDKFRLIKRYEFKPDDYMFRLTVTLDGGQSMQGFNFNGSAYTISFGPQIGPRFDKLDARYDYRQYYTYTNGKRKNAKLDRMGAAIIEDRPSWTAVSGKYFVFIAVPQTAQYTAKFTQSDNQGRVPSVLSGLSIARPALNQRVVTDEYYFYLGPKSQEILNVYHTGNHGFGFKDSSLVDAASSRGILAPLEKLLKWLLLLMYKIVPNYGIAIILITLLIKIAFFPLTKKGSEATSRMQELSPKIKELQEKYKDNPQKLNAEMAQFYQKEGYNPLSGCLPMLLQLPIFIAMYNLFNNHFDLRGASFIPGWIPDLSIPEAIFNFPEGVRIPILGWTAIRALPFIYVGSQLLYGKFTQAPGQQSTGQMKMMMYAMPIMFFFILYNVPSGLLLYWIFSNVFTLAQQIIINKYKHAKTGSQGQQIADAQPAQKTVIAPPKKKKKK